MLAKSRLNSTEALIPKALIDSVISHGAFVLIHNVLKEHNEMKEEIKILIRSSDLATRKFIENFSLLTKLYYHIV